MGSVDDEERMFGVCSRGVGVRKASLIERGKRSGFVFCWVRWCWGPFLLKCIHDLLYWEGGRGSRGRLSGLFYYWVGFGICIVQYHIVFSAV